MPKAPVVAVAMLTFALGAYVGLESLESDTSLSVNVFVGDLQGTFDAALAGSAEVLVDRAGFIAGSPAPMSGLDTGEIVNSVLTAGPGPMIAPLPQLALPLPLLGGSLWPTAVVGGRLEATLKPGGNGVGPLFEGALFGGAIRMEAVLEAFNQQVAAECSCLALDGPLALYVDESTPPACAIPVASTCGFDPATDPCDFVADFCGMILGLLKRDIDTDGNEVPDAISFGMWVGAQSVEIVGLLP